MLINILIFTLEMALLMSRKRIISFYYKHKSGGFTTRLYKAWAGLANNGYQVTYISTEKLPIEHQFITARLINCRSQQGTALFWIEYFIRATFTARKINKEHHIDSFFVFSFFYSTLALIAGLGCNIKTIVFIRADDLHTSSLKAFAKLRIKVHFLLEKFSVKHASLVVATNKNMMTFLKSRNKTKTKITYLPNNIVNADIEYSEIKYSDEDGVFRFVTASVLNEGKNILYTLQALDKINSTNWEFIIIGDDVENTGYRKILEQYIDTHDLQEKVKILGWQDNANNIVGRCDLFIISTIMEGSPNALLEALGTKISCIGSDIPEVSEILNYPDLVFDLKNPISLAKTLNSFCTDDHYRNKLANLATKCRERYIFDWEKHVVDLVDSVVSA